jgi:hypothetical protein
MGFELKNVENVVGAAVNHKWGIRESQRGFVWNRQKVRGSPDSLWRGYPVGSFRRGMPRKKWNAPLAHHPGNPLGAGHL